MTLLIHINIIPLLMDVFLCSFLLLLHSTIDILMFKMFFFYSAVVLLCSFCYREFRIQERDATPEGEKHVTGGKISQKRHFSIESENHRKIRVGIALKGPFYSPPAKGHLSLDQDAQSLEHFRHYSFPGYFVNPKFLKDYKL